METKWTNGPWRAEPSEASDGGIAIMADNGTLVGWVPGYTDHPMNIANARMLAAAPTMEAALEEAGRPFLVGRGDYDTLIAEFERRQEIANAALRAARGEQGEG